MRDGVARRLKSAETQPRPIDEETLRFIIDRAVGAIAVADPDLVLRYLNEPFARRLDVAPGVLRDQPVADIWHGTLPTPLEESLRRCLAGDRQFVSVEDPRLPDLSVGVQLMPLPDGTGVVIHLRDREQPGSASERRGVVEQDPVTGLLNRRSLVEIVTHELHRAQRSGPTVAMMFVMLHGFKEINQIHGHHIGDLVLENTGLRIRETLRSSDYVFRWEGTNLVVVLPQLADRLDTAVVADKMHEAITVPYRYHHVDLAPDCHIGIALYPDDAHECDALLNSANSAVIEAERRGVPYMHFDETTHRHATDRLRMRTALQRAFERSELELFYQPIVDPSGRIVGAEALMRWNHPERGQLEPGAFIDLAETSRLIKAIDKLALYNACRQLADWEGRGNLFVTLNISATDLADRNLVSVVSQALEGSGVQSPERLKLELTESRTIANLSDASSTIAGLAALGVDVWIDDFGTGQSSLSHLKHLRATTVKIDKDFVADLSASPDDRQYLEGIIGTVRARGKRIVLEGVGNRAQYELLAGLPVDYLQGYYFARPMPAGAFGDLIARGADVHLPLSRDEPDPER